MLIEFGDHSDKIRVLRDWPWSFDKILILLKEFNEHQQIKNIQINEVSFWVRVYDIPLMACNEYIDREIRTTLGRLEEVGLDEGEIE